MTKWMLAASAAALAMTGPAFADKGGHGNGGGQGHGQMERGNGGGHARTEGRGQGGDFRSDRGPRMERAEARGHAFARDERHGDSFRTERGKNREDRAAFRADRPTVRVKHDDGQRVREAAGLRRLDDGVRFAPRWDNNGLSRFEGCPPGLAKKGNGCLPPGQAKKIVGTTLPAALAASVLGGPYRDWYRDDDHYYYREDGDYIYRVRREGGLIEALFPANDRDYYYYPVGDSYPMSYNYYNVPYQYRTFYPDNGDMWYRYGDGAIYSVNPGNGLISGIAALLAGDLSVGQPLPPAYLVYNVPLSYRDRYYDTPNDWYRYNDGYIYRVDPTTQLITAVINALV
ncbi:hypothetical protein [Sphingomonas jaspsi]|uniref:hypothetical protein n=1 Tax=Sphingomonas jaspsi TaxID=392409 RepID=UPI0004B3B77F|nr:hypothetical protein [Sphingomonas jaspsi]